MVDVAAHSKGSQNYIHWGYLTLGTLLLLFPFVGLLLLSVMQGWRFPAVWPETWSLTHWQQLLTGKSDLGSSLFLSLGIGVAVAIPATAGGFLTGRFIAFSPYRNTWLLIAYLPFVLAPVVYAVVLHFYFIVLGLSGAIGGVWLGQFLLAYPYATILFTGYWNVRLRDMEQLVYTLGGSSWQTYRWVIWPMARDMVWVSLFQTFLISWFEYGLTRLIGVGKVHTLTLQVYQYVQESNPYLAALSSVLLFVPPLILLIINTRFVAGNKGVSHY